MTPGAPAVSAYPATKMTKKSPTTVTVPDSEVARQATDAWGGYIYQLNHTVFRWLTLGEDELLHIEFAEDIATSEDGKLDLTQVKRLELRYSPSP